MLYRFKKWIERKWLTHPLKFSPDIKYETIESIPFDEAVERVIWCLDSPALYSNQPTKDEQCWARVYGAASIGNCMINLRKEGPEALRAWVEALIEQDTKKLSGE